MKYKYQELIEDIQRNLSIVDVVQDATVLKKSSGDEWVGLCPFHSEKTPSFFVNENKNVYYCFGCQAKGNMFTFVMRHNGISFKEALRFLAHKANIDIEDYFEKNGSLGDIYNILQKHKKLMHSNKDNKDPDIVYIFSSVCGRFITRFPDKIDMFVDLYKEFIDALRYDLEEAKKIFSDLPNRLMRIQRA